MLSILITHYNRPDALNACVKAILNCDWSIDYEIVVSDDGSHEENLKKIDKSTITKFVSAKVNEGLAANINKGIMACEGGFILYVQEDFLILPDFMNILNEGRELLVKGTLDMIRYRANYKFNHLIPCSANISEIPKFSFRNFNINTFQYSDHPFLTTPDFFKKFGYYLAQTSVGYGETEYAIRIVNSKAKIGIASKNYFDENKNVISTVYSTPIKKKTGVKKSLWRFARAVRQHLEWLFYNPKNRKLYTYKNKRTS